MEFLLRKTNTFTYKTLLSSLVFFLVAILLFLISTHSVGAEVAINQETTANFVSGGNQSVGALAMQVLLSPLILLTNLLLSLSQTVFTWILDTQNIKTIVGSPVLYEMWTYVRDFLNMAFIMVLLWSAFCTIFQVEQYNYKKLLWKIVLMALLVNFSFPIARFIIDASNILMYSLIGTESSIFTGESLKGLSAPLTGLLAPQSPTAGFVIAKIIMVFMLAITLLAIGILLLIRLIALAILLILSPIAFVGFILPGSSSYANDWWNNLVKYSFFGPIMVFGVIVTVKLMTGIRSDLTKTAQTAASSNTEDPTFLGSMILLMVPIVLLWMVMGIAQKMSIAGAGTVMGGAQKIMKGAGKKFSGYNFVKKGYDSYATERKKREAEKNKNRYGAQIGSWANKQQDTILGVVSSDAKKRVEETERRAVQEQREEWKKQGGASMTELDAALKNKNSAKRKAAALEMSEKNGFGDGTNPIADLARYQKAFDAVRGDAVNSKAFKNKVEEKHIRLIIADDLARNRNGRTDAQIYEENLKNMSADELSKQKNLLNTTDFHTNFMSAKNARGTTTYDPRFIAEVAKKMKNADRLDWKNRGYTI